MKDIKFVNSEELNCLDEYATSLITGAISLQTLNNFHAAAFKKGLLKEDEVVNIESIYHLIKKLLSIYKAQLKNVVERLEITEEELLIEVQKIMGDLMLPEKEKFIE